MELRVARDCGLGARARPRSRGVGREGGFRGGELLRADGFGAGQDAEGNPCFRARQSGFPDSRDRLLCPVCGFLQMKGWTDTTVKI